MCQNTGNAMKTLWNDRYFQIWLRWSILLVTIHFIILGFATSWQFSVVDRVLLSRNQEGEVWKTLPSWLQISRFWDLTIIPVCLGIFLILYKKTKIMHRDEFLVWLGFGLGFGLVSGLVSGLVFGLTFGLVLGLVLGLTFRLVSGLVFGLTFGLASGLVLGLTFGLTFGLVSGLACCSLFGFLGAYKLIRYFCSLRFWRFVWTFLMVKSRI